VSCESSYRKSIDGINLKRKEKEKEQKKGTKKGDSPLFLKQDRNKRGQATFFIKKLPVPFYSPI
jgi:hypothetical protein